MKAVETENPDAEKFSAYTLKTIPEGKELSEEILFYGVDRDSHYIPIPMSEGDVYISSSYAEKMNLSAGDRVTLKEPFEDTVYTFEVTGICE